jgi:hypothetical protein
VREEGDLFLGARRGALACLNSFSDLYALHRFIPAFTRLNEESRRAQALRGPWPSGQSASRPPPPQPHSARQEAAPNNKTSVLAFLARLGSSAPAAALKSSRMLPSGYQKLTDPSTGRPYYVNLVTGQTSWSPPAGAEAAPTPAAGGAGGALLPSSVQQPWGRHSMPRLALWAQLSLLHLIHGSGARRTRPASLSPTQHPLARPGFDGVMPGPTQCRRHRGADRP